jgi:hypothetical protein
MAHSIELLLDQRADAAVRQIWQGLADARLPSQMRVASDTNRPHITLIAAERISPAVDEELAWLPEEFPRAAVLGAPLVFGDERMTLARLVIPSEALLSVHEVVYDNCAPYTTNVFAHSRPGQWTPHVTLGRRFTPAQIGEALTIAGLASDIPATIVGLRRWDGDAKREYLIS